MGSQLLPSNSSMRVFGSPGIDRRNRADVREKRGGLGSILEWTGSEAEWEKTDTPLSGMPASVVAGQSLHLRPSGYETHLAIWVERDIGG